MRKKQEELDEKMDKKEEDSEQLLINLFGTSDLREMSIVPQSSNIDDSDDDSDDEWLDQELEKIEKIRDMLLESTCYVFIMCNIFSYSLRFRVDLPLRSRNRKITNTCRYRVRVRKQLRSHVFYQYDCTALQHSGCFVSEWIYHTSVFWCLGSVLSEVLVKKKEVFIIKQNV